MIIIVTVCLLLFALMFFWICSIEPWKPASQIAIELVGYAIGGLGCLACLFGFFLL